MEPGSAPGLLRLGHGLDGTEGERVGVRSQRPKVEGVVDVSVDVSVSVTGRLWRRRHRRRRRRRQHRQATPPQGSRSARCSVCQLTPTHRLRFRDFGETSVRSFSEKANLFISSLFFRVGGNLESRLTMTVSL